MTGFKKAALTAAVLFASVIGAGSAYADTDVVAAPTGFFLPPNTNYSVSPYYRGASEDWGWTHGGITNPFTTATLNIGGYDVDSASGEVDNIYAYDNGVRTFIGSLSGIDDDYSYTTFALGSNFFDDIAAGLKVDVDIDVNNDGWYLTLSKSVISTDGSTLPPVTPAPEPATWAMMVLGFGAIGAMLRRHRAGFGVTAAA